MNKLYEILNAAKILALEIASVILTLIAVVEIIKRKLGW
jgi:hypothetical protein